ncbi:MAG: penicillin-binding transpeptidase domain-containing protein, partial [Planctomycetota bacterium]
MSTSGSRLVRIGLCYLLALAVVGGHMFVVMGFQHDDWLVRSYRNRWAFKDVPSVRGALLDRNGTVLAHDEPTFELECVYERFRLRHPVGAAIHGATLATKLTGGEVRFSYFGSALGPMAAARHLLSVPVGALLHGDLPKDDRRALQATAMTLLCAITERTRTAVRKELLATVKVDPDRRLGDALFGQDLEGMMRQFVSLQGRLVALDRELQRADAVRRGMPGATFDDDDVEGSETDRDPRGTGTHKSLLQRLDQFRVDTLDQRRTQRTAADGTVRPGEFLERMARPLARDLPFDLAAAVRVAASDQPGLVLEPSLRRVHPADLPPTLKQILGSVKALDQSPGPKGYLEERVTDALVDGLDELVPEDLTPLPSYQQSLAKQAQRSYAHVLRTRERRGQSGIEAMLDDSLRGTPGLRLVEHDAAAREQMLWSSLRVLPGSPVALTIDLELQRLLDAEIDRSLEHWRRIADQRGSDRDRIDVAMALIDARTGDVLALAGAPHESDNLPIFPPVLSWRGNGSVGSIVKPLYLLEQLVSERTGLPHADLAALEPCPQRYRGKDGRIYLCDHPHWGEGTDPVRALAKSCNTFFFQLAEAMGENGLRRALWRFGMLEAGVGGGDGRYQERAAELPTAMSPSPQWSEEHQWLQMRGIGYSLAANPLSIARCYAALATG